MGQVLHHGAVGISDGPNQECVAAIHGTSTNPATKANKPLTPGKRSTITSALSALGVAGFRKGLVAREDRITCDPPLGGGCLRCP